MRDYSWIADTAVEAKNYSDSLASYFAKAISKVSFEPITQKEMQRAWAVLTRDMVHFGVDPDIDGPPDLKATVAALQTMGIDQFNENMVDEEKLIPVLKSFFDQLFGTLSEHPEIFELLEEVDIIEDIVGTVVKRYVPILKLFPAFSNEALTIIPYLREPLFTALYELPEMEHHKLTRLTERIMRKFYQNQVRPNLVETLRDNLKGRNLLLPLIDEAVNHLPSDRCMTGLIAILCTPREELSQGRIISIVLQEYN